MFWELEVAQVRCLKLITKLTYYTCVSILRYWYVIESAVKTLKKMKKTMETILICQIYSEIESEGNGDLNQQLKSPFFFKHLDSDPYLSNKWENVLTLVLVLAVHV